MKTGMLNVPGARLHYEVRGSGPLVALVGSPMDADAFAPLAELLADEYTVLTLDPRGIKRSTVDDPDADSTPETRADDLSRLITHVDAGPATIFSSSGGAVVSLVLTQTHPEQVRKVIAHEPGLPELLDDRAELRAATQDYCTTYLDGDVVGAWTKFFAAADIPIPEVMVKEYFGGDRDPQAVADERYWFAHELRQSSWWVPDVAALRAASTEIVIGIGQESAGQLCDRTSRALAGELGIEPVLFPGDHTGFAEDPAAFVGPLRSAL